MVNATTPPDTGEPSRSFLDAAYRDLGYERGDLLNAVSTPEPESREAHAWVDKGEWLALARHVGAEKVFFVNNDPVIVFCELDQPPTDEDLRHLYRRVWCMARPQCLFLAFRGELRVCSLNHPPMRDSAPTAIPSFLERVERVADVAEKLHHYRREQVETGRLFADERFGDIDQRADKRLILDLRTVRRSLLAAGLGTRHADALIGRSIFIRYLEDRGVLTRDYFTRVAGGNESWLAVLREPLERPDAAHDRRPSDYCQVLRYKDFTFALFDQLSADFNGDMFPVSPEEREREKAAVTVDHLRRLRSFLLGDVDRDQPAFFFWAYDFSIVPIELISSIYEEFYHSSNDDNSGTHYTPSVLVEYVLSQALSPDVLDRSPRVLDPACGSGIFLVEAFRRMVRHWTQKNGTLPTPEQLRRILQTQVAGVDINREAVHVAAFSLYLALLHYQEPPDILHSKRLPNLVHRVDQPQGDQYLPVLFHADAFGLTATEATDLEQKLASSIRFAGRADAARLLEANRRLGVELHSFDVVVGNPPWSEIKLAVAVPCQHTPPGQLSRPFRYDAQRRMLVADKEVHTQHVESAKRSLPGEFHPLFDELKSRSDEACQPLRWARVHGRPVGDNSYSQLFIHRALSFAKHDAAIGLLVHSSVLFNDRPTSQAFRRAWLSHCRIRRVANFAHVRTLYFHGGIAPFVFACFQPADGDEPLSHFVYVSARLTETAQRLKAVVLTKNDRRLVRQAEVRETDYLWKTYWWGSHRDAALLGALGLHRRLADLERGDPEPGYGFQLGAGRPSATLRGLSSLDSDRLTWYGPLRQEWFEAAPRGIKRQPDERLYRGQRLLVVRGVKPSHYPLARLEYDEFSFRHTIYCVPLPSLPAWQAKLIVGIFWSALGRYWLFMTSGSWGPWYDSITSQDVLSMPVTFPAAGTSLAEEIVSVVDAIRTWLPPGGHVSADALAAHGARPDLTARLDGAIFDVFQLSQPERDLVQDFCHYTFDLFSNGPSSSALDGVRVRCASSSGTIAGVAGEAGELQGYLQVFLAVWNRELEPDGEFSWHVIRPPAADIPMVAVRFVTQEKGRPVALDGSSYTDQWAGVLQRLEAAMLQPADARRVYTDGMVRAVSDTDIIIIKRDERRLWTKSAAREDAEATLLQAMALQSAVAEA